MTRAVAHLGTGLIGAVVGWALIAYPLAAMFAPTRVAWDATSCPAGVFSITATARNVATGAITFVAGPTVSLPQSSVAVEFPNLPAGTYSVTASGRREDGQSFGAAPQTVLGLGPSAGSSATGRTRPPSVASTGRAAARKSVSAPTSAATATASTATRAVVPLTTAQGAATAKRTAPAPKFNAPEQKSPLVLEIDSAGRLVTTGADWRRMEVRDTDGDGLVDVVWIEMTDGEIWILRVKYP